MSNAVITDLSDCVLDCGVWTRITRFKPAQIVKGRMQEKAIEEHYDACISVQPFGPARSTVGNDQLERQPEGMRKSGRIRAFVTGIDELKTVDTSECRLPDRFCHRGTEYQVAWVSDWVEQGNYFEIEADRVGQ